MKTCSRCSIQKEYKDFYKNKRKKDGLSVACKVCDNISNKQSRVKHIEKTRKHRKNNRNKILQFIQIYKSENGCLKCGEKEPCCLDLHHVDPTSKEFEPSQATSITKFVEESKKCVVLCANCHRKLHANLICL